MESIKVPGGGAENRITSAIKRIIFFKVKRDRPTKTSNLTSPAGQGWMSFPLLNVKGTYFVLTDYYNFIAFGFAINFRLNKLAQIAL